MSQVRVLITIGVETSLTPSPVTAVEDISNAVAAALASYPGVTGVTTEGLAVEAETGA